MQVLTGHIFRFISTSFEDYSLSDMCRQLPLNVRLLVLRSHLQPTSPKASLAHECGRLGVCIRRFLVCHDRTEDGLFACRNFGKTDVVESYYRL